MDALDTFLKELVEAHGAPGFEGDVAEIMARYMKGVGEMSRGTRLHTWPQRTPNRSTTAHARNASREVSTSRPRRFFTISSRRPNG